MRYGWLRYAGKKKVTAVMGFTGAQNSRYCRHDEQASGPRPHSVDGSAVCEKDTHLQLEANILGKHAADQQPKRLGICDSLVWMLEKQPPHLFLYPGIRKPDCKFYSDRRILCPSCPDQRKHGRLWVARCVSIVRHSSHGTERARPQRYPLTSSTFLLGWAEVTGGF